ncbi:hypothetical protein [Mycobacterium sp. 852002-51163_SCH5372311]|uniref:hypothetical protein n=1 Tax=Mycobacterium sp. 852002-51163_SCH5372311 TaxID=1834097 RepID=UPI000A5DAD1E|nr:hypothetical protein [Mycobacterium sp. 852002-51163_SCH5372311]
MNRYQQALRAAGLLSSGAPAGYSQWLANAERRQAAPEVVVGIAQQHGIEPDSFGVLRDMEEIKDPLGKSFYLLPPGTSGDDARKAVLMTYVVNAGTDYAKAGERPGVTNDFPETPYSAAEVQRIADRQHANRWSYRQDVGFVDRSGGGLVTTPNGMLMGLGGNRILRLFTRHGGTAWGDIFMVNIGSRNSADAAQLLRLIIESGHAWCAGRDGRPFETDLALDRVLHHEERHCAQWAAKGYVGMIGGYGREVIRERIFRKTNRIEQDAGLSDGGYR